MAGPGGGPPRKSHTKSRKGCRTCKRRHIRCDEQFPQCRNCTKHNCRCDYMDMPAAGEEPMKGSRPPDLMMSPELQKRLDNWRLSGEPILAELRTSDPMYWMRFSTIDLRLIHHVVTLSSDLHSHGYSTCTAWAARMPTLITVALSHDFVMSAVLAFSASHLAWQTKNSDTENLAYHHRGVALKGLHEGIGHFSREVSDAILAASMLLSWQATEWKSWASLQQGVSTVMAAMRPWAHESELARFLDTQKTIARARTPSTPSFPHSSMGPPEEDVRRVDEMITGLHNLKLRLATNQEMADHAGRVLDYMTELRASFPIPSPERAFSKLQPLRDLIFWLPPSVLRANENDLAALTLLSHLYATALVVEGLFPEIGGAYLGSMCLPPLERIHEILQSRRTSQPSDTGCQVALQIVEFPIRLVANYKSRQRTMSSGMEAYRHSPHASPYLSSHAPLASPPESTATLYSNSPSQPSHNIPAGGAYFSGAQSVPTQRHSPGMRAPSIGEQSHSTGNPMSMNMVYHQQTTPQPRSSHDSNRMEYFGQPQQQQQQQQYHYYGVNTHNRDPVDGNYYISPVQDNRSQHH